MQFQLVKSYGDEDDEPQQRLITRPLSSSVEISMGGQAVTNWSLSPLGLVVFDTPPTEDSEIKAGFLFDVPVRFAQDQLNVSHATFLAGDIPEVPLIEVREGP